MIDARRGQVYLQAFDSGRPLCMADVLPASDAANRLAIIAPGRWRVAGPGAGPLAGADNVEAIELAAPDLMALGELAAAAQPEADVKPIYLRAPDARLAPA